MKESIFAYIYDFLSHVFEDNDLKENIQTIILFGSVAKKSFDKKSDIDLFFDIKNISNIDFIEKDIKKALKSFEIKAEKTWNLKGIKLPINFIVGSLEEKTWKNLKEEIISSGIILYGVYKEIPKNIEHYYLLYYSLSNLDRKKKMKFIRNFFGYSLKKRKEKKEYKQIGMLEEIHGVKLASNVVLVHSEDITKIKRIFTEFKIKYRIIETWIRK